MYVVFAHMGFIPIPELAGRTDFISMAIRGLRGILFPGQPAVVVFFIISGFCIHYPFRAGQSVPLAAYFLRRYLRIGLPLVACLILAHWVEPDHSAYNLRALNDAVLWSLVAEIIYYGLYPFLLPIIRRIGWTAALIAAYFAALSVMCIHPSTGVYQHLGPSLAWVVGLPSWLLGCWLAESFGAPVPNTNRAIWAWRFLACFCASSASALFFLAKIGYPWSLLLISWIFAQWLKRELAWDSTRAPSRWLEWAGQWSYSLYLVHMVILTAWIRWGPGPQAERLEWAIRLGVVLLASLLFYLIVERPSHHFARWLSQRAKK